MMLPPPCCGIEGSTAGYAEWINDTVESITRRFGSGPRLRAEEVTEVRTLPPPYAVLDAQRHVPAELACGVSRNHADRSGNVPSLSQRESRGEDSASPRSYSSSQAREPPFSAPVSDLHWSAINPGGPCEGSRDPGERECCTPLDLTLFGRSSRGPRIGRRRLTTTLGLPLSGTPRRRQSPAKRVLRRHRKR